MARRHPRRVALAGNLTFAETLGELHRLVGRTVMVGIHGRQSGALVQLAGFAGRLLGADDLPRWLEQYGVDPDDVPDTLAFEVAGGHTWGVETRGSGSATTTSAARPGDRNACWDGISTTVSC